MFRPPRIRSWTQNKTSHASAGAPPGGARGHFRSVHRLARLSTPGPVYSRICSLLLTALPLIAGLCGCTAQEAFFCPQDGCADKLIEEIRASTVSCHVAIAYFNHDDIAAALIDAHNRGVEVKVVGEASEDVDGGINYDVVRQLKKAGVPYRDDTNPKLMHNKYTILDGREVLTGSFNYTWSADNENNENLVLLTAPHMAQAFEADFQELWASGVE
jgi:phosphatidylserine/phosphatidylglycerophosphate/cardiolipin synthase-like enzyme